MRQYRAAQETVSLRQPRLAEVGSGAGNSHVESMLVTENPLRGNLGWLQGMVCDSLWCRLTLYV